MTSEKVNKILDGLQKPTWQTEERISSVAVLDALSVEKLDKVINDVIGSNVGYWKDEDGVLIGMASAIRSEILQELGLDAPKGGGSDTGN